jgi:tetratricopeptide (TPR) repeat protein
MPLVENAMKTKFYSAVVVVCLALMQASADAQDSDVAGKVFAIDGSATLERSGQSSPLTEGAVLQGGDEVVTGEPGRVAIELQDGSYIRLASGSRMKLPKQERKLGLFEGALHFLSHTTKHPVIETQQITAAIRGTEFTLASDKRQTTISMFSGVVDGESSTGKVHLTAGQGARFRQGSAPELFAVLASERSVQWSMFVPFVVEGPQSDTAKEAVSLYKSGKSAEALKRLEIASKRTPCGAEALLRARMMLSAGDPETGSKVLERCARSASDPASRASAAAALASVKLMQGDEASAETLSEAALKDAPASEGAQLARSFVLQERGDLEGALALVQDSRDPESLARKAELLFMSGRVPEAREILEGISERSWYGESVYGFVLMADREFAKAQDAFEKASAAAPGAGLPRVGLGIVRVNRGDLAGARSQFEQATVLEPSRGLYRSYLAKAYFEDDQYAPAHPEYERAIELDPNDPTPYLYRSFMRVAENDLVGALEDITKARELSGYRNVYRSSFLLDQDSAMQSASVGRVYQQLGFKERGRLEAITALVGDYQNATAHRLLSETQEDIFSADVIASEQRMANLFSPLSINVVDSIGTNVSLNEYSQLFERDGWRTAANTYFDSQDDVIKTGILSAYKHENIVLGLSADGVGRDGISDDPRASAGSVGVSLQGQPSWADRYLLEAKGVFDGSSNSDESVDGLAGSASAAYLHRFSPQVTGLIQSSYSRDRESKHIPQVSDETFLSTIIQDGVEDTEELGALLDRRTKRYETTVNTEAQLIAKADRLTSIVTLRNSSSDVDASDKNSILEDEANELNGLGATLRSNSAADLSSNAASYLGDYKLSDSLHLQFGGEVETLEWATRDEPPLYSDTTRRDLWSPKAGLIFTPSREVTARVGYGESLGKGVRTDLTSIEPTLIGGINQRYNDLVGTKSQNLGFGLDFHPRESTFLGAEWNRRWLEEAANDALYQYVRDYDIGEGYSTVAVGESYYLPISQDLASAYVYEVLSRHWVAGIDYRYVRQDTDDPVAASQISHDHRGKAFTRYFFSGGFFLQGSATYRYQDRSNIQIAANGSPFGSDNAWFMGAGVGYRLPTRHGLVLLDVQNIFGQDIAIDQISYFNEPVFNDPTVRLAVNFNF